MMKRKAFSFWEVVVVLTIMVILAAILFPVFNRGTPTPNRERSFCQSNLKQLALGVEQYIQDYNEKYPPTQNATGSWAELVFPYVKSEQIFQCLSDKRRITSKTTDYFINARLAGIEANTLDFKSLTILMGDGMGDSAPSYHLSQLPDAWRADENSPAWRHLDGANYAFAAGHVKAFKPEEITLAKPNAHRPTFLLR